MTHLNDRAPSANKRRKRSISRTLTLSLIVTVIVVQMVTVSSIYIILSIRAKSQLVQKADEYITSLNTVLEIPIWNLDDLSIKRIGEAHAHNDLVESIVIADYQGHKYYEFDRKSNSAVVSRSAEIIHNDHVIGKVEISLSAKSYAEMNRRLLISSLTTLLSVVLVLLIVTGLFSRRVLNRPLSLLNKIVNSYASTRDDAPKVDMPYREFQPVVDLLDEMRERIDFQMKELRQAEKKYRSIFENALEGIFQTTPDGRILNVNPSMARILGYESSEETVKAITDVGQQVYENSQQRIDLIELMKMGETITDFQLKFFRKDGSTVWVSLHARPIFDENGEIVMFQGSVEDITQRKLAEIALAESEAKMRSILNNIEIGVVLISPEMEILEMNKWMRELFPDADPNKSPLCYHIFNDPPCESICDDCPTYKTMQDGRVHESQKQMPLKGGNRYFRIVSSPILDVSGKVTAVIEMVDDVTEKLSLEHQLIQSQKMEAVGRLAGGIAHDFNNMLSIILGYGEIILNQIEKDHPHRKSMKEVVRAAFRASGLTRQLLAFSRKQVLEMHTLDINSVITGFERLLRRVIGEDITLMVTLSPEPCKVLADKGQFEQVLLNIAVNARDAMPDGGTLTIETATSVLDETYVAKRPHLTPGEYAMISISDTGSGMEKETLEHIFEPFFTTKGKEKGTGLGLATSYGIIKQHEGSIFVYSEPGQGSIFKIFLPLQRDKETTQEKETALPADLNGSETILLAEDNHEVRQLAYTILESHGYTVISAGSGEEALSAINTHTGPMHLLLTDVIMPGMNGKVLYEKIAEYVPTIKVIFMSGYTDNLIAHRDILDEGLHFIQKPFTMKTLAAKVRAVLDETD